MAAFQKRRRKKRRRRFTTDALKGHIYWLAEKLQMPARELAQRVDTAEMADWIGYSRYRAALEKAAAAKATAAKDAKQHQRGAPPVLVAGKRNMRGKQ